MSALLKLAERCEAATGQDRQLDIAILTLPEIGYRDIHGDGRLFDRGNDGFWSTDDCERRQLPSPTASIDAAMALVPEGYAFGTGNGTSDNDDVQGWAWCGVDEGPFLFATTPALALCAAVLRARSVQS